MALFIALYNGSRMRLVGRMFLLFVISFASFGLTSSFTGFLGLMIIILGIVTLEGLITIIRKHVDKIRIFIPKGIALAI